MKDNKDIVERFDSYTKTSFRHCLYHIYLKRNKQQDNETIIDIDECSFINEDNYDFIENRVKVMGYDMIIRNDLLYEALKALEQYQRDIIYLSLCKGMSDLKIGTMMNMSRSKVQRIKVKVSKQLREKMIGDDYNGKQDET